MHNSLERSGPDRAWARDALSQLAAECEDLTETPILQTSFPDLPGIDLFFKDEAATPTGSLKHRLARALFVAAICSGRLGPSTQVIECSSGNTAISAAYFAGLLGLSFTAVAPSTTAPAKVAAIRGFGGDCRLVRSGEIYDEAAALTQRQDGHFLDQFTQAERVSDWRSAQSLPAVYFRQLAGLEVCPDWFVTGAGTGGTAATIGRFIRHHPAACNTRLCVADPEYSAFFDAFRTGDRSITVDRASLIEGIGRPRVERSFVPEVIDRMIRVEDAASIAATRWISDRLGRSCGGSTGTAVQAAHRLAQEMHRAGQQGSIALLVCDDGLRYQDTYFDDSWVRSQGLDPAELSAPFT